MPFELAVAVAAVKGISGIVDGCLTIADSMKSRFGRNDAAKKQLQDQLKAIHANLTKVGELGEAASAYLEALDDVRRLEVDVTLLRQFLDDHAVELSNAMNTQFMSSWQTVQQLVARIDQNRDVAVKVHLNRQDWFNDSDSQAIGSHLNDFTSAYVSVTDRVDDRNYEKLCTALDALANPLQATRVLLHQTLTDQIFRGLRDLRTTPTP